MSILAINAGSSSLKFGLFEKGSMEPAVAGEINWAGGNRRQAHLVLRAGDAPPALSCVPVTDDLAAAACALRAAAEAGAEGWGGASAVSAVGHRVVHGGTEFCRSVRIDAKVKAAIARLAQLAPLHNPAALRGIEAAEAGLPGVPQVAVFDTAFFAGLPPEASVYPLPYEWYDQWGIRRFGFHGISHGYCAARALELLGAGFGGKGRAGAGSREEARLITCHLGGGCSAAAVRGGAAVASTMGFSPLEGLMMGTRCGSVDPGILLHLQREHGLSVAELEHALNHGSGLLGVSGVSADLADIESAAAQGNERARLAFNLFADRVRGSIGSLAATLGGVDALVFTDRIGEGSPALRAAACTGLGFMGLKLEPERNRCARADADIAAADSPARVFVLHTREEWVLARETARALGEGRGAVPGN